MRARSSVLLLARRRLPPRAWSRKGSRCATPSGSRTISRIRGSPGRGGAPARTDPDVARLAEELAESLGAKVTIETGRGGSGRLVIGYSSLEQLDGLLARIRGPVRQ